MKKAFMFFFGVLVALSSLFVSCSDNNSDGDKNDSLICQISVSNTNGGSAEITNYIGSSANVLIGNGVEVVATPDVGYKFIGWYLGNSDVLASTDAVFTFTASKNISLLAKFEKTFMVSVQSAGNGSVAIKDISDKSLELLIGSELTVIATPAADCDFLGWFVGDAETPVCTKLTYTFTVKESIALVAKFYKPFNPNGYDYVDLGLPSGIKWAAYNVGATKPEEYGDYFAWGEISPKNSYNESNSVTCGLSYSELKSRSIIGSDGNLTAEYDAARANWGGDWRMPTKAEQDELRSKCSWEWTSLNGVNGYRVTGPNGNSIFVPAAGYRDGTSLDSGGSTGLYWSSTPGESDSVNAYYLYFFGSVYDWGGYYRYYGRSVRPVCE